MHQNSSLLETTFVKSQSAFIRECRKRNIRIEKKQLEEWEKLGVLKPVLNGENGWFYDTFQIPIVALLLEEKKFLNVSGLEIDVKRTKKYIEKIEQVLPLLYQIRYYYQGELFGLHSSGVLPPFKLTKEQAKHYNQDFPKVYYDALKRYKPKEYSEQLGLTANAILKTRDEIYIQGYRFDSLPKWYPFMRMVRKTDNWKFTSLVENEVLLAHDFYILAEILTYFYRDLTGKEPLDPEDIFDGRGGSWKKRGCQKCGKEMKVGSSRERYCPRCKRNIIHNDGVTSKCYKCGKPLYKYVDGDEMANKPFKTGKKLAKNRPDVITQVKLHYGKATVYTQCECGALNYEPLEKGWF